MEYSNETTRTKETISAFYSALASRDTTIIASKFASQVDWFIPGDQELAPWLGYRTTSREVKAFFDLLLSNIESKSFELEHLIVEEDFGVATETFVYRMLLTGRDYSSLFSAHFRIENELIVYYRFLEDSQALVKSPTAK